MSIATRRLVSIGATVLAVHLVGSTPLWGAPPTYTIYDIGIIGPTDSGSQGNRVSSNGVATGRSLGTSGSRAWSWTELGGRVDLPNLAVPARAFSVGNGATDAGVVVGTGSTTAFGSSPLPLIWQGGVVSQLPLPGGQTLGRANDVNESLVAVGSINAGSAERASMYAGGVGTVITTTAADGSFMRTAFAINNAGLIVGSGVDPNNAAVNVGLVYDSNTNTMIKVGALPGLNGALNFDVSNAGHVVGSSMLNQGSGLPFIWTSGGGIQPIPLPAGTSSAIARGVNSDGWVVGIGSSAFAIPFLYDGSLTYRVHDLLSPGSGWDLATNTSSSALSISEDGIIVGTGVHNGLVRAYAMVPDSPVPVALEEFTALGRYNGIELRWRFSAASDVAQVELQRAPAAVGPWSTVTVEMENEGSMTVALDPSATADEVRFYRLSVRDQEGAVSLLGMVSAQREMASRRLALGAPTPNPAAGHTAVSLRLPSAGNAELVVIDVRGRVIRTLAKGRLSAGEHMQSWDGRTDRGWEAPAGVYFIRLTTQQGIKSQRVTLLR